VITLRAPHEIEKMRAAGRILRAALNAAEATVRPGVATAELETVIGEYIESREARAAFHGYRGFPGKCCISVDHEVVHGIPGDRRLEAGSIVSIDVGVFKDGYYSDAAVTLPVGEISDDKRRLLEDTRNALDAGIAQAREGNRLYDISAAIQAVCERGHYGIVRELVGHGIGSALHEEPQIPNYVPNPGERGIRLRTGMVLAIEPMVNLGGWEVRTLEDEWTIVTRDGSPSAHFEHTVAITKAGPDILTRE
jgi:methionyl aminopeptidase